jgi:hypothetical protein
VGGNCSCTEPKVQSCNKGEGFRIKLKKKLNARPPSPPERDKRVRPLEKPPGGRKYEKPKQSSTLLWCRSITMLLKNQYFRTSED